jgi:hypothetical protein
MDDVASVMSVSLSSCPPNANTNVNGEDMNNKVNVNDYIINTASSLHLIEHYESNISEIFNLKPDEFVANKELLLKNFLRIEAERTAMLESLKTFSGSLLGNGSSSVLLDFAKDFANRAYDQEPDLTTRLPPRRLLLQTPSNQTATQLDRSDELEDESLDELHESFGSDSSEESIDGQLASEVDNSVQTLNTIQQRWNNLHDTSLDDSSPLMVEDTTLLTIVQDAIGSVFDVHNPNLERIPVLTKSFISLFGPLTKANKSIYESKMNTVPNFQKSLSFASLLLECDPENKHEIESTNNSQEVNEYMNRLRLAVSRNNLKDDSAMIEAQELEQAIGVEVLEQLFQIGHPTRKLSIHALYFGALYNLLSNLTVYKLYAHLKSRSELRTGAKIKSREQLWSEAKELARSVDPNSVFDKTTTILQYLAQFAIPGQAKDDDWQAASVVTCDMFEHLTCFHGNAKQKNRLIRRWEKLDQSKVDNDGEDKNSRVYFSGDTSIHTMRRLKACRLVLVASLETAIKKRLPENFFGSRGFIRSILRVSSTDVERGFTGINRNFFETADVEEIQKVADNIEKKIVSKKLKSSDDTGKRTIIIESQEHIDCLKELLVTWRETVE